MKPPTSSVSSVAAGPDSVRVPSVHSMAAAKVQLKLLESAIFKAEQELEAMTSPEAEKKSPGRDRKFSRGALFLDGEAIKSISIDGSAICLEDWTARQHWQHTFIQHRSAGAIRQAGPRRASANLLCLMLMRYGTWAILGVEKWWMEMVGSLVLFPVVDSCQTLVLREGIIHPTYCIFCSSSWNHYPFGAYRIRPRQAMSGRMDIHCKFDNDVKCKPQSGRCIYIYILYIDTIVEYIIWFLLSIFNPLQLELNMVGSLLVL